MPPMASGGAPLADPLILDLRFQRWESVNCCLFELPGLCRLSQQP